MRKSVWRLMALAVAMAPLTIGTSYAQSLSDLANDTATPGDVLTYGMGYGQQRYSPLDQINSSNANALAPVWAYSLNDGRGQESFPLVHNGVMYVTNHKATMALDAKTGRQIWKSGVEYPAETPRVACCGIVNPGASFLWEVEKNKLAYALTDLTAFDSYRKSNPLTEYELSTWQHRFGLDIGFAVLESNHALKEAVNSVLQRPDVKNQLPELAKSVGLSFVAPTGEGIAPDFTMEMLRE